MWALQDSHHSRPKQTRPTKQKRQEFLPPLHTTGFHLVVMPVSVDFPLVGPNVPIIFVAVRTITVQIASVVVDLTLVTIPVRAISAQVSSLTAQ